MASSADLVLENFYWRIEAISPTSSERQQSFHAISTLELDTGQTSGMDRAFVVSWLGSDEEFLVDGEDICDDGVNRIATHRFEVRVTYSAKPGLDALALQQLMLSDRHDITKALRAASSQVGYDDSNTSTSLGILKRVRESDEIEIDGEVWTLVQTWRVDIQETE